MESPHVYDKSKYHHGSVEKLGLPAEHAKNHTVFFLRWLIEHNLMSDLFVGDGAEILQRYREGKATIHGVYDWWDCCLIDDMLSDEGNAFAMHYFDFERGRYLGDYAETLQQGLPSEFHVSYSEDNYQRIRQVIDRRYGSWKREHGGSTA